MDVAPVGAEDWLPVQEPPDYRQERLEYRQAKRDDWYRDCYYRWRLLLSRQGQRAEHESDEQAAAVAKKDRSGIEVVLEEAEDRSSKRHNHQREQVRAAPE